MQTFCIADVQIMKIEQSAIFMSSGHNIQEQYSRKEKLEAWVGDPQESAESRQEDRITLSGGEILEKYSNSLTASRKAYGLDNADQSLDPKLSMIKRLIEIFTGKKINLTDISDVNEDASDPEFSDCCPENQDTANNEAQQMEGWGVRYNLEESYSESEQTGVSMQGFVRTSDGQEIAFNLDLQMERSYLEQNNVSIRLGDAARIDPLVINFDGTAAQLTDWRFEFDLNSDGDKEEIPFVSSGSGILVFDKNGDMQVNEGTELFGPSTGNGFAELAALDEDNNNWIDENDTAYKSLSIWLRDQEGNESLTSLSQSGIGALNIGYIKSPFDLTDQNNNLKGQILSTGIYLNNSGTAGSIQQLDLVI
jgi:hypothetical protein